MQEANRLLNLNNEEMLSFYGLIVRARIGNAKSLTEASKFLFFFSVFSQKLIFQLKFWMGKENEL